MSGEMAVRQGIPLTLRLSKGERNPFFNGPLSPPDCSSTRKDGAIAVISLATYNLAEKGIQVVPVPRHQNRFLHAQEGLFTLVPRANAFFICNNGCWPSIHDLAGLGALTRWSVPVVEADKLLKLLFPFNITRHHLMPTLENAARVVEYWKTVLQ